MQLTWLGWSRSRSRSFWSRSHNRFLVSVSVSVSISVSHSLVSVLALVSLCSGLINKPDKNVDTRFLLYCHNPRVWQTDRQTDRQTSFSWLYRALHYMQLRGNNNDNEVAYLVRLPLPHWWKECISKYENSPSSATATIQYNVIVSIRNSM